MGVSCNPSGIESWSCTGGLFKLWHTSGGSHDSMTRRAKPSTPVFTVESGPTSKHQASLAVPLPHSSLLTLSRPPLLFTVIHAVVAPGRLVLPKTKCPHVIHLKAPGERGVSENTKKLPRDYDDGVFSPLDMGTFTTKQRIWDELLGLLSTEKVRHWVRHRTTHHVTWSPLVLLLADFVHLGVSVYGVGVWIYGWCVFFGPSPRGIVFPRVSAFQKKCPPPLPPLLPI